MKALRCALAVLTGACCLALLPIAHAVAATPTGFTTPVPDPDSSGTSAGEPTVTGTLDRPLNDRRIAEASGLAASALHPGVLWTHDDSGNPPRLFALARGGGVDAVITIAGTADVDWEALAAYRDARGRSMLAVGDIGDNNAVRKWIQVVIITEPSSLATQVVAPERLLRLSYPEGPVDAETLLVDPSSHRMFIVTKGLFGGRAYAVPAEVFPGVPGRPVADTGTLEPLGQVALPLVTDGLTLAGGRVLLRTYGTLSVMPPLRPEEAQAGSQSSGSQIAPWVPEITVGLPAQPQGEGLALTADGTSALLVSEGVGQPVIAFRLPAAFRQAAGLIAGSTGGPSSPPGAKPTPSRTTPPHPGPTGQATTRAGLFEGEGTLLAALGTMVTAVGFGLRVRRRKLRERARAAALARASTGMPLTRATSMHGRRSR